MLKRVWTDLVEPVGNAGKAEGAKGVVVGSVARGGGREEAAVCWRCRRGGRPGRLVDGGGGGEWAVVEEGHSSRAVLTSAAGRRAAAATARRRLRPSGRWSRVGRGGACVVRASSECMAGQQQRNGRAGVGVEQQCTKRQEAQQSTARRVRASGSLEAFTRSRRRLVGVWQCNFSHAGPHRCHHGSIGCFICGARR